ncbi:MAG: hypothetical protein HGA58_08485, partial [Chlorobiaceae bacterium]|nr:hypothetical protein [Chlorobiaceae bacterium]
MKTIVAITALACISILPTPGAGAASQDKRTEQVRFAGNAASTLIRGKLKGYQYIDYRL